MWDRRSRRSDQDAEPRQEKNAVGVMMSNRNSRRRQQGMHRRKCAKVIDNKAQARMPIKVREPQGRGISDNEMLPLSYFLFVPNVASGVPCNL
jgi:hypothetical protein